MFTTARTIELDLDLPRRARRSLAAKLVTPLKFLFRVWLNRRAFDRLAELDDVHLADIGLCREDIERVFANSGIADDPSARLSAIARSRARRALSRIS